MTKKLLPPMRLFALRLLDEQGTITPWGLRLEWKESLRGTDRALRESVASRNTFGQTTNAYKACRWLCENGFCVKEDPRLEAYSLRSLNTEARERVSQILRAQELLESKKNGNHLTPFGEETLRLIQKKYETR